MEDLLVMDIWARATLTKDGDAVQPLPEDFQEILGSYYVEKETYEWSWAFPMPEHNPGQGAEDALHVYQWLLKMTDLKRTTPLPTLFKELFPEGVRHCFSSVCTKNTLSLEFPTHDEGCRFVDALDEVFEETEAVRKVKYAGAPPMLNVIVGRGTAVHAALSAGSSYPLCGSGTNSTGSKRSGERKKTTAAVTCKKCLALLSNG